MENKNLKQIGIWGLIYAGVVYVLSLPILIWKSSNIGKIVFLAGFLAVMLNFSVKAVDKGIEYYKEYKGIKYQINEQKKYEERYANIKDRIDGLRLNTEKSRSEIDNIDKAKDLLLQAYMKSVDDKYKISLDEGKINDRIRLIESALDLMQEEARQAVKSKIIEVKELVKLHNKSIDSVEIRKICEQIADSVKLLTPEEKNRMLADLQEIGFKIEKFSNEADVIIRESRGIAVTGDSIYFYSPSY